MAWGFLKSKQSEDEQARGDKKSVVMAFLNQKGGVGKTTLAFHTACALKEAGKKVLAIDLDPQANMSFLFDEEVQKDNVSVYQLLINSLRELKALHSPVLLGDVLKETEQGIDVLSAHSDLASFELTVSGISSPRQLILKKFLEKNQLTSHYDAIIIDGPPTLGLIMVNIVCACDMLLVPFRPDRFSEQGLDQFHLMLENIEDMGIVRGPQHFYYLPNLVEVRRKQDEEGLQEIIERLKAQGLDGEVLPPIPNKIQLAKANSQRRSVFSYKAKEYDELKHYFQILAKKIEESICEEEK